MSGRARVALRAIAVIIGLILFGLILPSFIGCLMVVLLIFAMVDHSDRQYRTSVRSLNSAFRAVAHHDGAIGKVALAFSRSGRLSGPCYEYARRLMMGEDPIEAAAMSRVPLQLRTAVALQSAGTAQPDGKNSIRGENLSDNNQLATIDTTVMPVYGQFIYLTAVAMVTCLVLGFVSLFIVPTLKNMFEEFGLDYARYGWLFDMAPSIAILVFLTAVILVVIPILSRGHFFGVRLPRWIPTMPRLAENRSEILNGLADAIDAGWPMGQALAVSHTITLGTFDRRSLEKGMRLIQQGIQPAEALRRGGWIDSEEATWLSGATSQRTAELFRMIADQNVRDARSNLRWMMAVFFPALVLLLGSCVLAYAYGLFSILTGLLYGIA